MKYNQTHLKIIEDQKKESIEGGFYIEPLQPINRNTVQFKIIWENGQEELSNVSMIGNNIIVENMESELVYC